MPITSIFKQIFKHYGDYTVAIAVNLRNSYMSNSHFLFIYGIDQLCQYFIGTGIWPQTSRAGGKQSYWEQVLRIVWTFNLFFWIFTFDNYPPFKKAIGKVQRTLDSIYWRNEYCIISSSIPIGDFFKYVLKTFSYHIYI